MRVDTIIEIKTYIELNSSISCTFIFSGNYLGNSLKMSNLFIVCAIKKTFSNEH
jgi:hypothetical protein